MTSWRVSIHESYARVFFFSKIIFPRFCIYSGLIIENTARSSEENLLYSEIDEKSKKETYMSQQNENPLYETAVGDAVFNPIYDRFVACFFLSFFFYFSRQNVKSCNWAFLLRTWLYTVTMHCKWKLLEQSFPMVSLHHVAQGGSHLWVSGWDPKLWPFKWKLLRSIFLPCCLLWCTRWF